MTLMHASNETEDFRIKMLLSAYGWAGYGLFWTLMEMLCANPYHRIQLSDHFLMYIAENMQATKEDAIDIINFLTQKDGLFYGGRMVGWIASHRVPEKKEKE
jgi:hypothetical protein